MDTTPYGISLKWQTKQAEEEGNCEIFGPDAPSNTSKVGLFTVLFTVLFCTLVLCSSSVPSSSSGLAW